MTQQGLANFQVGVGGASIIVGILLIVGPGTPLFAAYEGTIAAAISGADSPLPGQAALTHWLLATCGAGVVGWGMAWTMIAHIPLRRGERWAFYCLASSLSAWAALDVAIALWFGVTGEVAFVLCAFAAAAIPLVLARPGRVTGTSAADH